MMVFSFKKWFMIHKKLVRKYLKYLAVIFLISFTSMLLVTLDEDYVDWFRAFHTTIDVDKMADDFSNDKNIYEDNTVAMDLAKKVKVLCLVLSVQSHMQGPLKVVNATWGNRCNKILYVMCSNRKDKDILNTCHITESKRHLVAKVRYMFRYVYQHYINEYDWFLKADDDTYVIMENLRFLLSHHNPDLPGYLGYHFNMHMRQGYMSGGAGYVISRKGLQKLFEEGFKVNGCDADGKDEDVEIGRCLQRAGVPPLVSYDKFGRESFHTDKFWQHFYGTYPSYLKKYSWNGVSDSIGCCSQFSVTFHHVNPQTMLFLHQILYRTNVYGHKLPDNVKNVFPRAKVLTMNN